MTHCAGYRAAAVAHSRNAAAVGIDAEPNAALPAGVLSVVARPEESRQLAWQAAAWPRVNWDRLLFSAKESVYKAWYPLTERWLDFHEASVSIDPSAGMFTAHFLVPGPILAGRELTSFSGRFLVSEGLVLTAIVVGAGEGG
jgi:4'-phosphopantetheinyl transferase EntD